MNLHKVFKVYYRKINIYSQGDGVLPYICDGEVRQFRGSQFKASVMTQGHIFLQFDTCNVLGGTISYFFMFLSSVIIHFMPFIQHTKKQ